MKKFTTAVAVTLLGATLAFAGPHEGGKGFGRHGRHGMFGKRLAAALNLTDAQKAQIKDIHKASREENKAFFQSARATMKELFEAKKAGDTAKADSLKPQVDSLRAQMKTIRANEEAKIATVLTPEQNAKWQELKAKRAERFQP